MLEWVKNKLVELGAQGATITAVGIGKFLIQLEGVFIIVAIVGVYLIIFGNKSFGTKLTSGAILLEFLAEVLSKC